ncbi:ferredoxin [Mycobacterium sp. GA-2829]|uniref:ferredoxin n=1 Tax=Mycobacterium sp. GA-2829 TaxID=1772283 RepID=UPI00073FD96D|nr:cytochrome [Mycobacterium sp. GA-2829]
MKVAVDSERCMGHGQCYAHGPDVYEPDEEGFCVVLKPFVEGDQLKQAVAGAEACPESAISVSEDTDA